MLNRSRDTPSNPRRQVRIVVGLAWPKTTPRDRRFRLGEPWPTIHELISSGAQRGAGDRGYRVALLRAASEGSVLSGVLRSLQHADIAVFDVTPQRGAVNANVLVEIGLARGMGLNPILIARTTDAHTHLPSDLRGITVRCYDRSTPTDRTSICALVCSRTKKLAKPHISGK